MTITGLAREIADLLGFDLDPVYVDPRPREVKDANCSAEKARRLLDYKTGVTLRDGLSQMIRDIEKRGPRRFTYHLDLEIVSELAPRTWRDRVF